MRSTVIRKSTYPSGTGSDDEEIVNTVLLALEDPQLIAIAHFLQRQNFADLQYLLLAHDGLGLLHLVLF